ncbi:dipeptidase PepE [Shewanella sp. JM162201]|uniref:Peptidase E n=1 Tax=Shewanella jiangmenensis TaxID=2837387 RepID=A0ABS5UY05_9GAMM|nr:dipeptidase PepE [Shewanella jiangmenensis]MBT1442956.1 dipeptidase PepE [Shewanella jiangmenensis]
MTIKALLLSASRVGDTPYLEHTLPFIKPLTETARNWVFIPYAGISLGYDAYLEKVREGLKALNIHISGIHEHADPRQAVRDADGIMVGGGNTFHLLHELYRYDLLFTIREQVEAGKPYVGWSAGSNIAGLSIRTTNDMPIIEPPSFTALGLVPFQLNPHYTDYQAPGHNGETRAQRLLEFTLVDPLTPIVGIQEGTALYREGSSLTLQGDKEGYFFKGSVQKEPIAAGADLSHLL